MSFFSRIEWSTTSKVFLKSMNKQPTKLPLSIYCIHWSINFTSAVWQLCFWWNPDCSSWINLYLLRLFIRCLFTCFSKILDMVGKIEMGLQFDGSDFCPPLYMGNALAHLSWLRKYPGYMLLFIESAITGERQFAANFIIFISPTL